MCIFLAKLLNYCVIAKKNGRAGSENFSGAGASAILVLLRQKLFHEHTA